MSNTPDFSGARWFKSSRSNGAQNNCVETAFVLGFIGVQDTKDPHRRDRLVFSSQQWAAFIADVQAGHRDL
ncbi:DUF397 domain-containing protein [Saccharopolyspora cebuensis]|uniref:DUF397 domain-containing protein n=1 Tax=Saccharopolyspora cebuensis TaxID=418759 RepID=A0ABV4CGB9_9PSEU